MDEYTASRSIEEAGQHGAKGSMGAQERGRRQTRTREREARGQGRGPGVTYGYAQSYPWSRDNIGSIY